MVEHRTSGEWRALLYADRTEGKETALTMRGPQILRDFYTEKAREMGTSISDLLRSAAIDWMIAVTSPDRRSYHSWIAALWELHRTAPEDVERVAQRPEVWEDPHPSITESLERLVRADDAEWMRNRDILLLDRAKYKEVLTDLQAEVRQVPPEELVTVSLAGEPVQMTRTLAMSLGSLPEEGKSQGELATPSPDLLAEAVRKVIRQMRDEGEL